MQRRTPLDLAAAVRGRRHELNLTQAAVAASAGVSRSFLARLETGKTTGGLDEVLAVLDSLGLTIELQPETSHPADTSPGLADLDGLLASYHRG